MPVKTSGITKIKKLDDEKQIVYGEVYAPYEIDAHGEMMTPDDIELMAHRFMERSLDGRIDTMHDNSPNGSKPVESFIARKGDLDYSEGAWVLGVKIIDDEVWDKIKKGEINGFSLEAMVMKKEVEVEYEVFSHNVGYTEDTNGHSHVFFIELDENGKVVSGRTSKVDGHFHEIKRASATTENSGHSHRFFLN